ncbi:MAG: nucleoside-diphosphate-sugar epimerase [Flavobacteriaceae bacterium]|jgi:nucleoside-diphosphate-sugar epimerase
MKIAVIGGSGFVGTRLIDILIDKHEVINIDKNNSSKYSNITRIADIRSIDLLSTSFSDFNLVILLAAEHKDNISPKSLYYDVNVDGTNNVLKCMDDFGVKNIIFTSSVAVYGLDNDNPDESHIINPFNHYGISKWNAEETIERWYQKNKLDKSVLVLRPTVIFGERNRGNVFNLLKQIASGKFIMIGQGNNKKSMAYVGNVVAFIFDRVEKIEKGSKTFNYVDKPDLSMNELVNQVDVILKKKTIPIKLPKFFGMLIGYFIDLISFILRTEFSISSVRVKKFCATTQFNSDKLYSHFTPPYSLHDGLSKTINYEFIDEKSDDVVFYSE